MSDFINATAIPLSDLVPFTNHPFKLYQGKRSEALINSVRESGILTPIIVRPKGDKYEILSGHNRVEAAKTVGFETISAIVREGVSDDDARLIVTVTNLMQRSFTDLSHSERAAALSEHYNAIKNQGRRTDILSSISTLLGENETSDTMRHKLKARDVISKTYGIGGTVVAQYLRVVKLIKPLQERLDKGEISLRAAVELSYLASKTQELLDKIITREKCRIEAKVASDLREAETKASGKLDKNEILHVINKGNGKDAGLRSIKINKDLISQFFENDITDIEISDTISKALESWFANGNE